MRNNQVLSKVKIFNTLKKNQTTLRQYSVKRIGLFGSFVRGEQKSTSDVDFLVEFRKPTFDNFMDLSFFLKEKFGRKVDLITPDGLSKYLKPHVEGEVAWHEVR